MPLECVLKRNVSGMTFLGKEEESKEEKRQEERGRRRDVFPHEDPCRKRRVQISLEGPLPPSFCLSACVPYIRKNVQELLKREWKTTKKGVS